MDTKYSHPTKLHPVCAIIREIDKLEDPKNLKQSSTKIYTLKNHCEQFLNTTN